MAESAHGTAEGSLFSSLSSSHSRTQQLPPEPGYDSDGSGFSISDDLEGSQDTRDRNSWSVADEEEEMRKLRERKVASDGPGQAVASPETRSQAAARAKGKAKAVEEERQDEGEDEVDAEEGNNADDLSLSDGVEDADDAEVDEEADVDVDGDPELEQYSQVDDDQEYDSAGDDVPRAARKRSKGSIKAIRGDGQDEFESEDEDDDMPASPLKPRLKIKLKLPIVPASSTSNTATPVPEEEKVMQTPSRRAVAKRTAAVRGRRRIQDIESSEDEVESEDEEAPQSEQEPEEEEEEDMDVDIDVDNTPATTRSQRSTKSRPMTSRQAVLANVVDASHVALDSELIGQSSVGNAGKSKKKVLNETELALRKEENARKRKNLSEKKLEDEKLETINRLLKKQTRPRQKRAGGPSNSAGSSVPPVAAPNRGKRPVARGGRAKGGRARGGTRGRGPAGEEGEEGEREDGEGTMDVDGEYAGEGDEGEEEIVGEGEEEEVPEGSAGGSDRTRGSQGRATVPMLRWVSTTRIVSEVTVPEDTEASDLAEKSSTEPAGAQEVNGDRDVDMADAQSTKTSQTNPAAGDSSGKANVNEPSTSDIVQNSLSVSGTGTPANLPTPQSQAANSSVNYQKKMVNYFAIPSALLSSAGTRTTTNSSSIGTPISETAGSILTSSVLQEGPTRPAASTCAVSGCTVARKYRLVKDWTRGACGIEHLKMLEAQLSS